MTSIHFNVGYLFVESLFHLISLVEWKLVWQLEYRPYRFHIKRSFTSKLKTQSSPPPSTKIATSIIPLNPNIQNRFMSTKVVSPPGKSACVSWPRVSCATAPHRTKTQALYCTSNRAFLHIQGKSLRGSMFARETLGWLGAWGWIDVCHAFSRVHRGRFFRFFERFVCFWNVSSVFVTQFGCCFWGWGSGHEEIV